MNWAEEELSGISLGDARLDRRASKLLECMSNPSASQHSAGVWRAAEIKAAYRLIEREDVDWRDLMAPLGTRLCSAWLTKLSSCALKIRRS